MLQDKALLVRLSISLPGNSRKDASITADTISRLSMTAKSGRWLKQIFPDEAIEPLTKISGEIRTWHYEHTLPWSDEGYRILPTAMHADYTDAMRTFRHQYESARDTFLSQMSDWEAWAKEAHNGSFDASLYDSDKVRRKFSLKADFTPIPSSDDFRVTVDADIRADLDSRVASAETQAQQDLWSRLAAPLAAMAVKLAEPERVNGAPPIFRDSLVENIRTVCSLIPKLTLAADAQLSLFAQEAQSLTIHSPDTLRQSSSTRADTAARAKAILDRMSGYLPVAQP